jgi:hypothetical protein
MKNELISDSGTLEIQSSSLNIFEAFICISRVSGTTDDYYSNYIYISKRYWKFDEYSADNRESSFIELVHI